MEKTISAHLFAALVSTKEQRFVFMAGTPEQQKFDDAATKIESAIEDPANLTPEILQKITDLKISAIADKDNSKRMNELEDIVNKKTELSREIGETEKKTADTNPDWKKIATDIESTDAAKKTVAIEAAQKILVESRDQIHDLSGTIMNLEALDARLLAKVTVKVIAAHNQNIERVQALDKANVIPFVSGEKIGGKDATDELAKIETRGNDFISKDLNDALKATKEAEGPAAKKIAEDKVKKLVKDRREEIYSKIRDASDGSPKPYVNAEKQVTVLLGQLKVMNDEVKAVLGSEEAPAASVTPALTAADTKKVDALKDAMIKEDTSAIDKSLTELNTLPAGERKTRMDAINKALVTAVHTKSHLDLDTSGNIVSVKGAPTSAPAAAELSKEVKTNFQMLLDLFEKFFKLLRGEKIDGANLTGLGIELLRIEDQIEKLKEENPNFSKKPDILKQIDGLELKHQEISLQMEVEKKRAKKFVNEANDIAATNRLGVTTALDKYGRPFIAPNNKIPGMTPFQSQTHMNYMTDMVRKQYPDIGVTQTAGVRQGVTFHIHGDVNINSHNRTNNSRKAVNTNNINGDHNTANASADKSQNGSNEQMQTGGVGAAQEGTAQNKAKVKAKPVVPVYEIPADSVLPSGSL